MIKFLVFFCWALLFALPHHTIAYPLDAYPETEIRRLEAARLAVLAKSRNRLQAPGALLPTSLVNLRLLKHSDLQLPTPDPDFSEHAIELLGEQADLYGLAILDLSDPDNPRYAEHRADFAQNVGSVGKIAVALAFFQALADTYPHDLDKRRQILRETIITADKFILYDEHKVHLWNPQKKTLQIRELRLGDRGSLWEYLDWTLSASSNAAAAMLMKQAMLLHHFGQTYPLKEDRAVAFFKDTPRQQLLNLYKKTFLVPLTRNGLDLKSFRQGSFFTYNGKQQLPTGYSSYGTARELMRFLVLMEQGKLVDTFSSLEIKRLLYMTKHRIRYASSPALDDSAVYFKSGSLYSCNNAPGIACKKYQGNVRNHMNSIAVVETPAGIKRLFYITVLISNVLDKNSAVDHQTLATKIHRSIEADHPPPPTPPGQIPADLLFGQQLIGFEQEQQLRLQTAEIQLHLTSLGYDIGPIDGQIGRKTRSAIKAFQNSHQLEVDGKSSVQLLEKLKIAAEKLTLPGTSQNSQTKLLPKRFRQNEIISS